MPAPRPGLLRRYGKSLLPASGGNWAFASLLRWTGIYRPETRIIWRVVRHLQQLAWVEGIGLEDGLPRSSNHSVLGRS
jgi:hypothetical protein